MTVDNDPGFIHLRTHSAYSLLEGALPLAKIIELVEADAMPAVGVMDTGNLFGALEFSEKAAAAGIQPIIGCSLRVDFHDIIADPRKAQAVVPSSLVFIARSEEGFANLVHLVSSSFLQAENETLSHIAIEDLQHHSQGLLVLSGGPTGVLDKVIHDKKEDLAKSRLEKLYNLFGDNFYIEIQRHKKDEERHIEPVLIDFAYDHGVPLVATNECFFAERKDFEAQDALLAIAEGRVVAEQDRRRLTAEHYFKTRKTMMEEFNNLPEALENTIEIAKRVASRPTTRKPILPRFTKADENALDNDIQAAEAAELSAQAEEGLRKRLISHGIAPHTSEEDYWARLKLELDIIEGMKFPGYFLIVADFIQWAKAHDIPVGPGRGSGAGSLVAFALTITDLDPLRFNLLFERFLNPERVSMPDFDIDFCQDRRDDVIRYVQEKYGTDQVAQIITFGTLQARAVMRDVGRVLQMPYGQVDRLCKLVPSNPANPVRLGQAIAEEPRLKEARDQEPIVARMLDIAQRLEGLYRHASTHAAGIVIGDRPLSQLVPLYRDPRSDMPVTQYNMKWVEQAGLVKFDFLGLKTLTVLDRAIAFCAKRGVKIDISAIPLDDEAAYKLYARAETVGVFQVESGGMRRALLDMKPDRFEDIIALVALYRPGPMENIPTFCARKHERETPDYLHEKLEPILSETFGIIVYQEQVMQIAQVLSGYSLGEADLLRRAMGKKIKQEMDKQKERFVAGAMENGLERATADYIFDLVAKFANYGFNKSHAAAYALVSYQTAYMKANYPVEFLAASMTLDMGNTDKLSDFRREALRLGIEVRPPSVNESEAEFAVRDGAIIYSLCALKGVGRQAVEHLVSMRGDQPFKDLADFAARINPSEVNKRMLESLVAAGAFDRLHANRAEILANSEMILRTAALAADSVKTGQNELFGEAGEQPLHLNSTKPWLESERLHREQASVGFYLSAHPLDEYHEILLKSRVQLWSDFANAVRNGATAGRIAGTILQKNERKTRSGNRMGILKISDPTGEYEAVIFSEALYQFHELLEPGQCVVLIVNAEDEAEGIRIRIESVENLKKIANKQMRNMRVFLRDDAPLSSLSRYLENGGDGDVSLILLTQEGQREVEVKLPGQYQISPQVASAVRAVPGIVEVEMA